MELKTVSVEVDGAVATVTLDRPDRLNSWTGRMHTELRHVYDGLERDPSVRVVVLTGAGRGFCAGADFSALEGHVERGGYDPGTGPDLVTPGAPVLDRFDADFAWMLGLRLVTIAAVNGPAAGAGFALMCFSDLRLVAPEAKLTTAHGRLNLPAEFGLSWLLPRLIGMTAASDLLLSSRIVLGREAHALGLTNRLAEPDEIAGEAMDWARTLVRDVAPDSLAVTKRQLWLDQLGADLRTSVERSNRLLDEHMHRADYAEAVRAFLAKRPADWSSEPARLPEE